MACFKCGSGKHFVRDCPEWEAPDGDLLDRRAELQARVLIVRLVVMSFRIDLMSFWLEVLRFRLEVLSFRLVVPLSKPRPSTTISYDNCWSKGVIDFSLKVMMVASPAPTSPTYLQRGRSVVLSLLLRLGLAFLGPGSV